MIFFDVTKTGAAGHRSGLTRVSRRLREELGAAATETRWPEWKGENAHRDDWFITTEIFSLEERAGFEELLERRPCRFAAVFHDAIPLKHPHITWPQSVARHPAYMKMLARFDRIWAVSEASRHELVEFWRWQGIEEPPPVETLALGADFSAVPRVTQEVAPRGRSLLCLGIIEPRKNQDFLLDVAEHLWRDGLDFELHIVGRINPHFGDPIARRIKRLQRKVRSLHFHEAAGDATVMELYRSVRAMAFPTIAEGCGLPLLEALWMGVPCVCSDLPVLRENANGGGCVAVEANDFVAWKETLRRALTDDPWWARLAEEARRRELPTWRAAADKLRSELEDIS